MILLLTGLIWPNISLASTNETEIPTYMISTRDIFQYEGVDGPGYSNNYSFSNITELSQSCPSEVVTFVHGWNVDEEKAKERLDRVKMSLEQDNYTNISLVGLSWGSDTEWQAAQSIAKWNGPRLADFISNLAQKCAELGQDNPVIRLIAHSLGARVILSSLDSLNKNPMWKNNANNNSSITSVHLLGAAVDDEEISKDPQDVLNDLTNWGTVKTDYGSAIEEEVDKFYNLFNPKDNVFEPNSEYPFSPVQIYPSFEGDLALGFKGSLVTPSKLPQNYIPIDVQNEIKNISDADGIEGEDLGLCNSTKIPFFCKVRNEGWDYGLCNFIAMTCADPPEVGDNHAGYIGFRNLTNSSLLKDDGAINIVIDHWNQ